MTDVDTRAREMARKLLAGIGYNDSDTFDGERLLDAIADYIAPLLALRRAAERERDEARRDLDAFRAAQDRAEARAAALRKALKDIRDRSTAWFESNGHATWNEIGSIVSEALAADQAGGSAEATGIVPLTEMLRHSGPISSMETVQPLDGPEAEDSAWDLVGPIGRPFLRPHATTPQPPQSEAGAVPAGWKLVPVEAGADMVRAGREVWRRFERQAPDSGHGFCSRWEAIFTVYAAMLAAAPSPPSGEDRVQALEENLETAIGFLECYASDPGPMLSAFLDQARALLARQP